MSVVTEPVALTVIYDDTCQLCHRCKRWLTQSRQLVPIGLVAASDTDSLTRLGVHQAVVPVGDELVVIGHISPGQAQPVWVGPDAFITCLWALADHRALAGKLQRPTMRPMAKAVFHALSASRDSISKVFDERLTSGPACATASGTGSIQ